MGRTLIERRTLLMLAPAGVLAAGLAGVAAWARWRPGGAGTAGIGGPFTLQDGDGKAVTDRDFRGRWMLVYFGYTRCPDACPTALQDMANALDALTPEQRAKIAPLFISVDPERDTPAVVRDYVRAFDAPITGLSGTPAQVAAAAKAYRVYYARHPRADGDYEMDHSSIIYLMDPRGEFAGNFTHETAPEVIAAKLRTLVG